ncbi:hypothetical protein Clacol_002151 [Clathrus columnatus]|uniref:Uncharacterized protein n=1 Tax=Clathrus columnatus TaxID=1419009 RepID=A0AAV5A5A9_9AGAM|nr:hypothetical protein Clacol_002151 [Clathrus columnatus]
MPRNKLSVDEQAFVDYWTDQMMYFKKTIRRADLYIRDIPRERYTAAYKEVSNSGLVAGGEWGKPLPEGRTRWESWEPKRQDREAYVNYMKVLINRYPLASPVKYASTLSFRLFIQLIDVMEQCRFPRLIDFGEKFLEDTKPKPRYNADIPLVLPIQRDPDEAPIDHPFIRPRSREMPRDPVKRLSPQDWKQLERVGETFFVKDEDDPTGFTAFKLASIVYIESGKYYKICYEGLADSIRVEEGEMLAMIKDGIWI